VVEPPPNRRLAAGQRLFRPHEKHVVLPSTYDHDGVHIVSNSHNRAAHGVLTSQLADGTRVFALQEVAVLYYLTLTRLGPLSDSSDVRVELLTVADVLYGAAHRDWWRSAPRSRVRTTPWASSEGSLGAATHAKHKVLPIPEGLRERKGHTK